MSTLSKPPALKPGDTIGVFSPSSYVEKEDIEQSKAVLESKGYNVLIHPQTYERHGQMAGTNEQKADALHSLWLDENIKVIWAAGGGNRALNLIEHIDFETLKATPKTLVGFSDVTALLNAITARAGIPALHGPVFKNLHRHGNDEIEHALNILSGATSEINLAQSNIINEGQASGALIGGCLSLFQYIADTQDCLPLEGALLFLEDTGDHLSRFDRMFAHLHRLGVFDKIGALILGEFHDLQDGARPFGLSLEEVIREYTEGKDIPVVMNAPFGHAKTLFSMPIGGRATLDTALKTLSMKDSASNT